MLICGFILCIAGVQAPAAPASTRFLLITDELDVVPIRLAGLDEERLHSIERGTDRRESRDIVACIAIVRQQPDRPAATEPGMLRLADGRQFPGEPASPARPSRPGANEVLAWHSSWLGRLEVRLDEIDWAVLRPLTSGARPQDPASGRFEPQRSDVIVLVNGDVLEGFVAQMREKVTLEVEDGSRVIEIPLERIAAINIVAPPAESQPARRRAWLADGTIMNVSRIEIDEGGMARLSADGVSGGTRLDVRHLSAVIFAPERMIPLASVEPSKVSGPETRYLIPEPHATEDDALLGLSPIELRGPIRVEYELPPGANRFAAEAILPESARHYGDFELIVRDGEREVFRKRLHAANPLANVNVPLTSSTLVIELSQGRHGAIQNHAVLNRAMLRVN